MRKGRKRNLKAVNRSGAALVEFSLVLPLLLLLLIGSIEIGGAILTRHTLSEAARAGARVYALKKKKTEADVYLAVAKVMEPAGLENYTLSLDPDPSVEVEQLTPLTVTVSIPSTEYSWVASPWFVRGKTISSRCTMPADLGESEADTDVTDDGSFVPGVIDEDSVDEGSGTTDKELDKLQKEAQKAKEKAQKAQDKADKEAEKAAKEQAKADEAAKKAAEEGTAKAAEDAAKAQEKADEAVAKAAEKQQEANEAWKAYEEAAAKLP
jgi:Flp pilus assembly protein TadG